MATVNTRPDNVYNAALIIDSTPKCQYIEIGSVKVGICNGNKAYPIIIDNCHHSVINDISVTSSEMPISILNSTFMDIIEIRGVFSGAVGLNISDSQINNDRCVISTDATIAINVVSNSNVIFGFVRTTGGCAIGIRVDTAHVTGLQHQSDAGTPNAGSTNQFFAVNYA